MHEKPSDFLYHLAVPTTLSAAERTIVPSAPATPGRMALPFIHGFRFGIHTQELWLSAGIRALGHTMELIFYPTAAEVPAKQLVLTASG